MIITRDGAQVAELRPLRRRAIAVTELIARRASLPIVDPVSLRNEIDDILDPTL